MNFKAQIYIADNSLSFYKKWTLSELLSWTTITIFFFFTIILIINQKYFEIEMIEFISKTISYISLFIFVISSFMRFIEYEKLNGKLDGEILFENKIILINKNPFELDKIRDLKISFDNIYGDSTGNRKIGPIYSQGLKNSISFYYESQYIEVFYQLRNTQQQKNLKDNLFHLIISETIPLNTRSLQYIDKSHRETVEFKSLVHRYIKENIFTCTEGLLVIGYSSDREASELRKIYCS
jgi:hypothetical protein